MSTKPEGRKSAAKSEVEKRGETFYPGPSRNQLAAFPPKERWDNWVELDPKAWPKCVEHGYALVPTTCFNCEAACGLLAYVDRETLEIRKFEGNPEHPASRGRNCAKGPATLNQVQDPDRILYPLKRVGARGAGEWAKVTWDAALDDIAGRIRRAIQEERRHEVMYHVGRPGEDGYTERILAAWGVDGHNSHTNVCSSNGRAGYQYWMGFDRPSADFANANVILLISSHLETGHYFNPHAQRVIDGKARGAKLIVVDTRLSNTATHADYWLATQPGSEAALMLAIANYMIQEGRYNREFVRRWWNWEEYLAHEWPDVPRTFEAFEGVLRELYASYTPEFAAQEAGITADTVRASGGDGRQRRHAPCNPYVAERRRRQRRRLAGLAHAVPVECAAGGGRDRGRDLSQRLEQVRAAPDLHPAASAALERVHLAARVSAGDERALVPAAALPGAGARQARGVLHAGLQPGVDEPRRLHVDRGALGREEGGPARRPHSHLERDRDFRRLRAADGTRARAARHAFVRDSRRRVDRLPAAGPARGAPAPGARGRRRHARGESGRGVGGERVLDRAHLANRSRWVDGDPEVRRVEGEAGGEARDRRVLRLDVRALGAGAGRARGGRGDDAARVHAALRRVRDPEEDRAAARGGGAGGGALGCGRGSVRARVHADGGGAADEHRADPEPGSGCGGAAAGGSAGWRWCGAARLPDPERPPRVLLAHARRVGLGRVRDPDLSQEPRASRTARTGRTRPHLDLPIARCTFIRAARMPNG